MILHLTQLKFFTHTQIFVNTLYGKPISHKSVSLRNLKNIYNWGQCRKCNNESTESAYRTLHLSEKAEKWFSIICLVIPCIIELLLGLALDIIKGSLDIAKALLLDVFDMAVVCVAKLIKIVAWTIDTLMLSPLSYLVNNCFNSLEPDMALSLENERKALASVERIITQASQIPEPQIPPPDTLENHPNKTGQMSKKYRYKRK